MKEANVILRFGRGIKVFFTDVFQRVRKIDKHKLAKLAPVVSGAIFALASLLVLSYFIVFPSRGYFHADNTDTIMWAEAMYDAKWIYNLDFTYAGYLPFGGSLLMLLFIPFFGVSMTTHVLGMLAFFILLLAVLTWFFRSLGFGWFYTGLSLFAVSFGVAGSDKIREIFYGHVIYYSLGVLFFIFGLGLVFRLEKLLEAEGKTLRKRFIVTSIVTFAFFLGASLNGMHSLTLFSVPVAGGYFLERFFRKQPSFFQGGNKAFFLVFGVIAVAILIGTGVNLLLALKVSQGYADAYSSYSGPSDWANNLEKFIQHWYTLYGVDVAHGDPMKSFDSVINLFRIVSGTLILLIPFVALARYGKIRDHRLRILVLAHFIMTVILMIGYVFGFLAAASWRLSPLLATSIIVTVAYFKQVLDNLDTRRVAIVFLTPVLVTGMMTMIMIMRMPADYNLDLGVNDCYLISRELEEHDLEYGYANFWRANVVTVVSGSKVKARSITDNLQPYYYQSNRTWFEDQEGVDEYFVLLTESEYQKATQKTWFENDHTEFTIEGTVTYHVLVFPDNIF